MESGAVCGLDCMADAALLISMDRSAASPCARPRGKAATAANAPGAALARPALAHGPWVPTGSPAPDRAAAPALDPLAPAPDEAAAAARRWRQRVETAGRRTANAALTVLDVDPTNISEFEQGPAGVCVHAGP